MSRPKKEPYFASVPGYVTLSNARGQSLALPKELVYKNLKTTRYQPNYVGPNGLQCREVGGRAEVKYP